MADEIKGKKMAIVHVDGKNFKREIEESDVPVLIDFWAEWCGPCRMMAPVFEQLSGDYKGRLKFAKIDTDSNSALAQKYSIQGIPALVLTKKGKEVDRIVGFAPKEILKARIDEILKSA